MKKNNMDIGYIALGFFAMLSIFFICATLGRVSVKTECDFGEIQYGINETYDCWMDDIVSEYCPLPTELHCDIELESSLLVGMVWV